MPGAPPGAPGLPPSLAGMPGMPPSSAAGLLSLAGHGLPGMPPTSLQQLMARHEHMKVRKSLFKKCLDSFFYECWHQLVICKHHQFALLLFYLFLNM